MKLQQFNGGLHTLPEAQFIGITEGTVYENIDSDSGVIKSVMLPKKTDIKTEKYAYYFNAANKWISAKEPRDYLEYRNNLYYTDRIGRPKRINSSGEEFNLGMSKPSAFSASAAASPKAVKEVKITSVNTATGLSVKDQYYVLVNQDEDAQSNALHFLVNSQGRISTIAQSTNDPVIFPQLDTSSSTAKRTVTVSDIKGVTAGSVGFALYRQYDGEWRFVGLVPASGSLVDNIEDISGKPRLDQAKFGAISGVVQYVATFYDNVTGNEGPPSNPTGELKLTDGGYVNLTRLPNTSDSQVTSIRIYRVGGNLGQFTLVATVPISQNTYVDKLRDIDVPGTLLASEDAGPAPNGLSYLRQAYAMLFGATGTRLRFTPVGQPDRWPATFFLQFEEDITGIAPVANGILVFTRFKTYIVTGTGPTSLSQYLLSSDQGCISYDSVQLIGTEAIWASLDGVCSSSGNRPVVITKDKLGKLKLTPTNSCVYDEAYYLVEADSSILVIEKGIVKRLNLNVLSLVVAKDIFYGWSDGFLLEMFASDVPATFKFTSARITEGTLTANKTYKDVFTYLEGRIIINILINDKSVQTVELEGKDSFSVKIPQSLQRGFFIQFQLEGTGKVAEMQYNIGS